MKSSLTIKKAKYGKPKRSSSSAGLRTHMPPAKGKTKAPFGKVQRQVVKKLKG